MGLAQLPEKTRSAVDNAVQVLGHMAREETRWTGRPFHVEVSPTNACNLSCVMCERPELAYISAQRLDSFAEELFPHVTLVTPSAHSEPAMGDFDALMAHCERFGLKLNMITNGTLITDRHAEKLRGKVYRIDFSIDTHLPAVYERIRRGARYDRMLAGLRRLIRLSQDEHFPLQLVVVLMAQNLTSLEGLLHFARREGIRQVRIQKLLPFFRNPERMHVAERFAPAQIREHLDRALATATHLGIELDLDLNPAERTVGLEETEASLREQRWIHLLYETSVARKGSFCIQLATYARVLPEGNVYPCCRGWDEELKMGNIFEGSFEDTWNGQAYQQLREEFFSGELREGCRRCSLSGQGTL